jgi:hypothetical protein
MGLNTAIGILFIRENTQMSICKVCGGTGWKLKVQRGRAIYLNRSSSVENARVMVAREAR